ncbi:MAG TPA: thiamine pyrophosphate-dependent enzyme [Bryobacteraceae bacterium]|nr:thiamine pyrophosphate-dependent enzyme [Bryobacteraceae bacterium]
MSDRQQGIHRRNFLQGVGIAGAAIPALSGTEQGGEPRSETAGAVSGKTPESDGDQTTADILVDALIQWDVTHVFGMVGDGINPILDALRRRKDKIRFIGVRHEEAAAFMAGGWAKHTGRLGVCLATTGPGAVHLMNGLYDAAFDGAPVLAITGETFHDLGGLRFVQGLDTKALMEDVSIYNVRVSGPLHARTVVNRACRAALGHRGVAHLTIAKDTQAMKLSTDKPSMENHGLQTSASWLPVKDAPSVEQLHAAADLLNGGRRIAILAGQGALHARAEVTQVADVLAAPVAKALLGKAVLPDDSPFTTGGIGHLGTQPSEWAMHNCDTVLILGSTMPWIDSYPKPGKARGVQVDRNPDRIGLRYPVEIGLVGDTKATLAALLPMLKRKSDRAFVEEARRRVSEWDGLLDRIASSTQVPLRPQVVMKAVSDLIADNAVLSLDCGANTHFAARHIRLRANQQLTSPGMLATMAPGLPFAIAAQFAYPDRQSVAIVGDGGFAMLMAELSTAVHHQLPVKVVVLKNNSLSEVRFEQEDLGYPQFGCDLSPIDFAAFAKSCGADGFRCTRPEEVRPAITSALRSSKAALVEAVVDADEKPAKPAELKG